MTRTLEVRPFGSFADFRNGVNFSASSRGLGDLAVIGVGDFQDNERLIDFTGLERISRILVGLEDEALLRDGDLLFVRSNGSKKLIGRCMIIKGVRGAVTHSGFTIRARVTSPEIDPEWILQYFATGLARRDIMRRGGGTNISNLSQQILRDLPIPVPSPEYQQQLLRTSERFSQTLQLLGSLLKVKHIFKRGIVHQLLSGQKRFPQFANKWKTVTLGDVLKYTSRRVPKPAGTFLSAGVRSHGKGVFLKEDFPADGIALEELFVLRDLDLVVNITFGWEGAIAIVPPKADGALVSHRFPTYQFDRTKALPEYFRHLIRTRRFVFDVACASPGGAGRNRVLDRKEFLEIPVTLPSPAEQQVIAGLLDGLDREIELLERLHQAVALQKRAVLSRLISGEISVPA